MTPQDRSFGRFHRRVRIVGDVSSSSADVEDNEHRFGADICHDGQRVLSVAGRSIRTPWTTCPLAAVQLAELHDTPLLSSPYKVLRQVRLAHQCTHMIDMAALAVSAAARGVTSRQYDCALAVEDKAGSDWRIGTLQRDDEPSTHWVVKDGIVLEPASYAGCEMQRSGRWIEERAASIEETESVFVMQRAMLVAGGKRVILDEHETAANQVWMTGACFAFQSSRINEARRRFGSTRTFSQPDELLTDLDSPRDPTA
jgi:hypothetical protein